MTTLLKKQTIQRLAVVAVAVVSSMSVFTTQAVTDKEMDEARATTALWYLRYVNNGSDYLEKLSPKSLPELEKSLKAKEKDNIKAFKGVKTPSDYAGWDKQKLVEYWSVTFFKSSGLNEAGKGAAPRVKKKISAMSVSAPTAMSPESEETKATQRPEPTAADTAALAPTAAEVVDEALATDSALMAADNEVEQVAVDKKNKKSGSTWIYVIALVVLVGVVVWLVIFASRTMQSSAQAAKEENGDDASEPRAEDKPVSRRAVVEEVESEPAASVSENALRDKFARTLASKDEEIRTLHREINELREECLRLGEENGRLTSDLNISQRELEALKGRLRAASAVTSAASPAKAPGAVTRVNDKDVVSGNRERLHREERGGSESPKAPREIYLGRVNSKGLFVRADRKPVEQKTVYVLTTTDGYTGDYRILQNPEVIGMCLDNPEHYLAGGCVAQDITDTEGADIIRVLSAGTAIFEDGCWRVLRKAKISYE